MARQQVGDLAFGIALIFEIAVFILIFAVEEVADALEDRHGVGFRGRVLSQVDQPFVQFVDVREVEIARQYETACHPVVFARDGMHVLDVVFAEGAVAQVAEEHFAGEFDMFLKPCRIIESRRIGSDGMFDPVVYALEYLLDRGVVVRTDTVDVNVARFGEEFDVGQSGPVLSPVVLLLHQDLHLVESVKRSAVLLQVEIQRLEQPDERDAAFVFDRIAHNGLKCGQRYLFSPYATNTGPYFSTEEAV